MASGKPTPPVPAGSTGSRPGIFQRLYDSVLGWSAHPRAAPILSALSFAESSFFPIPPDVMLAPMCLARPQRAWFFAGLCTVSSVLGGMLGYLIGLLAFHWIEPWLMGSSYAGAFTAAVESFERYGAVYVLLAGFTPIPYKVFTIGAGVVGMPVLPFLLGSTGGRGARFFLVAGLIRLLGEKGARRLRAWVDAIGWSVLALAVVVMLAWWYFGGGA
jgi:membrane protein YqaA with SNARE-associated domain